MAVSSPARGFTNFAVYFYLSWFAQVTRNEGNITTSTFSSAILSVLGRSNQGIRTDHELTDESKVSGSKKSDDA